MSHDKHRRHDRMVKLLEQFLHSYELTTKNPHYGHWEWHQILDHEYGLSSRDPRILDMLELGLVRIHKETKVKRFSPEYPVRPIQHLFERQPRRKLFLTPKAVQFWEDLPKSRKGLYIRPW